MCCLEEKNNENAVVQESAPAQQELGSHMGREPGETGGQQVSQHNASARESDGDRAPELSLPDLSNGPGMLLD